METLNNIAQLLGYLVGGGAVAWSSVWIIGGIFGWLARRVAYRKLRPLLDLDFSIEHHGRAERVVEGRDRQIIRRDGKGWRAHYDSRRYTTTDWAGPLCETPLAAYTAACLQDWGQ